MKKITIVFFFIFSVSKLNAQTKQAFVNAGIKAMQDGDYYSAGGYFTNALTFDETDAAVFLKLAEAARLYNDYQGAINWYEKYLSSDKKNKDATAWYYLADMKKYKGKYDGAKTSFQHYYSLHLNDSSFMSRKSFHEISACDSALILMHDSVPVDILNAGNSVNTVYSDFGAQQSGDSVMYFSSQRFMDSQKDKKKKQAFVSKILKSKSGSEGWQTPSTVDRLFNPPGYLNCNSSISADHRLLIFSRCTPLNLSSYHSELFISEWKNGKWQSPVKLGKEINSKEFTSTQACIAANGANGYLIYFSSDRPGGFGGLDLWQCNYAGNVLSSPVNLGPEINSIGNEVTPFFDNLMNTLYFSSDWHTGMGGYDIFKSVLRNGQFSRSVNIGYPLNTSCNDLYFTLQNNGKEGLLTSNRPGSMYLYTQTCCYDIYHFKIAEPIPKENTDSLRIADSLLVAEKVNRVADSTELTRLLPLKLYFDNDQPGRRSTDTTTQKSYDETYREYLANKPDYVKAFQLQKKGGENSSININTFFYTTIEASYQNLIRFTEVLARQLASGRKITLTLQGCASPLARDDYNSKLSKRRISSVLNYFKKYNNGEIIAYLNRQNLVIVEDPAGESLSSKKVSDDYNNKQKSVYHPDACLERRIEVISINYH